MADTLDVKYEFERWMSQQGESAIYIGDGLYSRGAVCDQANAFRAGFEIGRADALASRPAELDEAWVLLFEALPHISPHAVNPAIARVGPIEDAYINTLIRKYLERVAAPSHATSKEK